jgi:hypothetical protein
MGLFLEQKDVEALSYWSKNTWRGIRDGVKSQSDLTRPRFGFRVIKPFKLDGKSQRLPDMQGVILGCKDEFAYIQTGDLFTTDREPLKDYIHKNAIERGFKHYGSWQVDASFIPRSVSKLSPAELKHFQDPGSKHLASAVMAFLKTLAVNNPTALSKDNLDHLGGESGTNVAFLTSKIVEGVKNAGLLSTLNNPHFTIDGLINNATFDCHSYQDRDKAGIYIRTYHMSISGQSTKHCILYVGQSGDLETRAKYWKKQTAHELVADAESVEMHAICLMPKEIYYEY